MLELICTGGLVNIFLFCFPYRRARTKPPSMVKSQGTVCSIAIQYKIFGVTPPLACEFCIRAHVMASQGAGAILIVLSGSVLI